MFRTFALSSTPSLRWHGPLVQTGPQTSSMSAGWTIPVSLQSKLWARDGGCDSSRRPATNSGNIPGSFEFCKAVRSGGPLPPLRRRLEPPCYHDACRGGQLSTEGPPVLPNRLRSAAVRRRLIILNRNIFRQQKWEEIRMQSARFCIVILVHQVLAQENLHAAEAG